MPLSTPSSSPSGSQSPPSGPPSSNQSPASLTAPLAPQSMARAPEDTDSQGSPSTHGTPNRTAVDLPRSQSASKGGCWTCRLRRKKCDEQRRGDSCQTCIRLKIPCLGWGTKRPDWMRDKQAVEEWKSGIKAQLMRQGLIRGQPRSSLMQAPSPAPSHSRVQPYHHVSSSARSRHSSLSQVDQDTEFGYRYLDSTHDLLGGQGNPPMVPVISNGSNPSFHRLSISSFSDADISPPLFPSGPHTSSPGTASAGTNDPFHFDFSHLAGQGHAGSGLPLDYDLRPPSPVPAPMQGFSALSGLNREEFVIYYFNYVRKLQYFFAGNSVTNATYSLVLQEPQGAITNAVCALASLHCKRRRIAEGLESPDPNPDLSPAKLFYDGAGFQIASTKQLLGHYTENEAIAALHLITYSLLSGGAVDWRVPLAVGYDWLTQTGLPVDGNPILTMLTFGFTGRCIIKTIMWLDIISSITVMRAPRYLALYRRLFGHTSAYWSAPRLSEDNSDLRGDFLSGCPDDVMIAIGEVSTLAQWKASELSSGSLSVRELIRRGDEIEQQLRRYHCDGAGCADVNQVPLHPGLPQLPGTGHFPNDEARRLTANVFREAAILYLHTVLSDANPAVPEISASVGTIMQLMNQLPVSEADRSLVFPICIAGCLADDPVHRGTLSGRLQAQDQSFGNLLQTRTAMEAVWQKRDNHGITVDWRQSLREQGRNLLLI